MTTTDVLLVLATALSPLIAVRVSRYLDIRKEARDRKFRIFHVLMATRVYNLSLGHVEALNSLELEFSPRIKSEKVVLDAWQAYMDHLGAVGMDSGEWVRKRVELMCDMLYAMSVSLGYSFSKTQIKNGVYSPHRHTQLEEEQDKIRSLAIELLEGKRIIPVGLMYSQNVPPTTEASPVSTEEIQPGQPETKA